MEIIFLQAISGTALTFVILLGMRLISLVKTVNKQQEQIDELINKHNTTISILKDMNQVSKDIANKVISIEERVDKYAKIVE